MIITQIIDNDGEWVDGTPTLHMQKYRQVIKHGNKSAFSYLTHIIAPDIPIVPVTNVSPQFTGFNRLGLGDIYTVYPSTTITIEADVELPDNVMTIMFVELGTNDEWLNAKYRFDATIQDGKLSLPVKLPIGNFILSCKRINQGLDYVNAGFHLAFNDIQFNCIGEI